jgi:tetratricopeptide (TPR) repeat protein
LLAAFGACQNDAAYLATLGDLLNQQGRYQEASEHLERALMLNSKLKGAQLSYAIALAGIGDSLAAQALLESLLADPTLPEHLRTALLRQQALQNTPVLQTRWTLNARWGYDSNLLSAPNLTGLTLTGLAGGDFRWDTGTSLLSQAGQYYRTDAQFELRRLEPNGVRWDIAASMRNRHSPVEGLAGATQVDLAAERNRSPAGPGNGATLATWGHYISVAASALTARSGTRFASLSLAGGVALAWHQGWAADCRTRLGLDLQARYYDNSRLLSGRYTGLVGSLSCEPPQGTQWLLGVKAGRDMAENPERSGGDQNQLGIRAAGFLPLSALTSNKMGWGSALTKGSIVADLDASFYQDARGFSPFLESGRTRTMERYSIRLEYQYPIARFGAVVLGAEATRQRSNIGLFQVQSAGPYMTFRASW